VARLAAQAGDHDLQLVFAQTFGIIAGHPGILLENDFAQIRHGQ
jgi:hypothetical protein